MYLTQEELCREFLAPEQVKAIEHEKDIREFRFRPVRGGLNEALVHQASFYDLNDLYRYVAFCVCDPPVSLSDVYTEKYCDKDDRIGWYNIHIVMVKKSSGNFPVGYVSFIPRSRFGSLYYDDFSYGDCIG